MTTLRWRKMDPPPGGTRTAYTTGDAGPLGPLVRIVYWGPSRDATPSWYCQIRQEPDRNYDQWDGWRWSTPLIRDEQAPGGYREVAAFNERDIRALVAEHWETIEAEARQTIADGERALAEREAQALTPPPAEPDAVQQLVDAADTDAADVRPASDVADALHERYRHTLATVVHRLRDTADRVERRGQPGLNLRDLRTDHTWAAGEVVDTVNAMLGNLQLGGLVTAARDADVALRTGGEE